MVLYTWQHLFSLTSTVDHLLDRNMWKVFLVLQIQTKDRRNIRFGKKSAVTSVVFIYTRMVLRDPGTFMSFRYFFVIS